MRHNLKSWVTRTENCHLSNYAIADYFAETDLAAGDRFFRSFSRKCKQLAAFSSSGKSYDNIRF